MRTTLALAFVTALTALAVTGCTGEAERSAAPVALPGASMSSASGSPRGAAIADPPRLRRLWAGEEPDFWASAPSPDGRYVTEVDYTTGNLAVIDLVTGNLLGLTDKKSWEESSSYAGPSIFSPDGRRVVYSWYNADSGNHEIKVLDFSVDAAGVPRGSNPRVVHSGWPIFAYDLYGWVSDDEVLAGITRPDQTEALGFLSISAGSVRVLKSFDWQDGRAGLSPDRRFVAYDEPVTAGGEDGRDIHLVSIDGTEERTLVEGPGDDVVLGWVPGDGSLLYYSDFSGNPSIWQLPMAAGRPAGPAQLVRDDARGVEPIGFAGGVFYFGVEVHHEAYQAAKIDFERKRVEVLPTSFDVPTFRQAMAWSPDGEYLVHVGDGGRVVSLLDPRGNTVRQWTVDLRINRARVRWTPDGKAVVFNGTDAQGRQGFVRVDLASGDTEMIRRRHVGSETTREFTFSPDGRTLYFVRPHVVNGTFSDSVAYLMARDLVRGTERTVRSVHGGNGFLSGSPDGAWIAHSVEGRTRSGMLWLVPPDGGEMRLLLEEDVGVRLQIVGWTADSESLVFLRIRLLGNRTERVVELWQAFSDDREPRRVAVLPDFASGAASLHPNGRTIVYRTGRLQGEIWGLDGITPAGRSRVGSEMESR